MGELGLGPPRCGLSVGIGAVMFSEATGAGVVGYTCVDVTVDGSKMVAVVNKFEVNIVGGRVMVVSCTAVIEAVDSMVTADVTVINVVAVVSEVETDVSVEVRIEEVVTTREIVVEVVVIREVVVGGMTTIGEEVVGGMIATVVEDNVEVVGIKEDVCEEVADEMVAFGG